MKQKVNKNYWILRINKKDENLFNKKKEIK